ncbi:unnamed protein product [Cylicostephanus goldi]|uniref:Major facilitator superfamily associated domain-containing protein n=1 Tax=Cylicostephanus goldi TaxID=71465 RepID=A0A3P7QPR4_CYLGO|nr:unnamed protein product [Cylicostephanus goldi]
MAEPKTPWKSIYLAGACSFVQAAQFSIYISSMWPYLRTLDPDAVETQFGYIVALYSFAQCISAPCFGYWSNRIEQVRTSDFIHRENNQTYHKYIKFLDILIIAKL